MVLACLSYKKVVFEIESGILAKWVEMYAVWRIEKTVYHLSSIHQ